MKEEFTSARWMKREEMAKFLEADVDCTRKELCNSIQALDATMQDLHQVQ